MRTTLALSLAVLLAGTISAQDLGTEEQRASGKTVYDEKCAQCHGVTGAGDGPAAPYLRPAPRDFTSGIFKFRTTASGELPIDADLRRSIRQGMPYTGMPPWPDLSESEVTNLVYYLKTFNDDFAGPYGNPEPIEFTEPVKVSAESIERGRLVYEENQCIDCHGELGRGDGPSAPTLEDNWGFHIKPADMTKRWTYRGGPTRRDIYRTFTTGLDGSPMPSYSIDPPEDQWHLVNYVYSLSRDEAEYGTLVVAEGVDRPLDINDPTLFQTADSTLFPVVGQVIDPGRSFFPGINAVEVTSVYNAEEIAVRLRWHDMSAQTSGRNGPDLSAPDIEPDTSITRDEYTDAIAIQLPAQTVEGVEKPYFLFGDKDHAVDLWYIEMGSQTPQLIRSRGGRDMATLETVLEARADYDRGEWEVVFKRSRSVEDGVGFEEGSFVPMAFSVWDGFYAERGPKRGVTSWYHVYIAPLEKESPYGAMAAWGFGTLLVGLGFVFFVRRRYSDQV